VTGVESEHKLPVLDDFGPLLMNPVGPADLVVAGDAVRLDSQASLVTLERLARAAVLLQVVALPEGQRCGLLPAGRVPLSLCQTRDAAEDAETQKLDRGVQEILLTKNFLQER
jgi:hypothetical protein